MKKRSPYISNLPPKHNEDAIPWTCVKCGKVQNEDGTCANIANNICPKCWHNCNIIINALNYSWKKQWISYEDILELIGEEGTLFTIQYSSTFLGNDHNGTIRPGEQVIAAHNMVIDAVRTDNA